MVDKKVKPVEIPDAIPDELLEDIPEDLEFVKSEIAIPPKNIKEILKSQKAKPIWVKWDSEKELTVKYISKKSLESRKLKNKDGTPKIIEFASSTMFLLDENEDIIVQPVNFFIHKSLNTQIEKLHLWETQDLVRICYSGKKPVPDKPAQKFHSFYVEVI
jgi:hypothetical protein